ADPHPAPYGGPDIARLRRRDRLLDDRTLADPDGRRGRLSELDPADDPLVLSPEACRRSAQERAGREARGDPPSPSRHIAARRSKSADDRMAALKAQLCSRVSVKRIAGHSSIVVRKSQALRARKTGTPSWSSALAEGF